MNQGPPENNVTTAEGSFKAGQGSAPSPQPQSSATRARKGGVLTFMADSLAFVLREIIRFFAGIFRWIIGIMLLTLLFYGVGSGRSEAVKVWGEEVKYEVIKEGKEDRVIGLVKLSGEIFKSNDFGLEGINSEEYVPVFKALAKNDDVKAVVVVVDSPGGEVYAADELYKALKDLAGKKPVYVYGENLLASGAYYLAMGANKVYVGDLTVVGSIGVLMEVYNYDGLLDKLGIKVRRLTNTGGKFKTGEGLFDNDPNGEEDRLYQHLIDSAYNRFVSVVAKGRHLPVSQVKAIADGRVMPAADALDYKLVDKISTFDQLIADVEKAHNLSEASIYLYKPYEGPSWLRSLLGVKGFVKLLSGSGAHRSRLMYLYPYAK